MDFSNILEEIDKAKDCELKNILKTKLFLKGKANGIIKQLLELKKDEVIPFDVAIKLVKFFQEADVYSVRKVYADTPYWIIEERGNYKYAFKIGPDSTVKQNYSTMKIDSNKYDVFVEYNSLSKDYIMIVIDMEKHLLMNAEYVYQFSNHANINGMHNQLFDEDELARVIQTAEADKLLIDLARTEG